MSESSGHDRQDPALLRVQSGKIPILALNVIELAGCVYRCERLFVADD
jgi:hypothetical protein